VVPQSVVMMLFLKSSVTQYFALSPIKVSNVRPRALAYDIHLQRQREEPQRALASLGMLRLLAALNPLISPT
jgi:hypothetical protein